MRYSIPKDKETQDQEWKQILRSLTGADARTADQALKFIMDQANGTESYDPDASYRKLYGFYTRLGLEPERNMDAFFNENERSLENFRKELEKFWRVLEIHSLNPGSSLQDNYKNMKAAPAKYDQMLRDADAREKRPGGMREVEPEDAPEQTWDDGALPLVNKKSPYYAAVAGTVYEEMYDLWQTIRKNMDFRQRENQLLKEDMEQLLSKTQLHYIRHNRSGSYLPMTEKEHKELQNLQGECIKDLTRLSITEALKPTCEALNRLMVQNKNQLDGLSPDQLPPLAGVLQGTKRASIEFNNRNKKKIGGSMSSREAVEYTDENGIRHRGFFTPEVEEKSELADAEKLFLKYKQKYPRYAKILNHLFVKKYDEFRGPAFYTMAGMGPGYPTSDQFIKGQKWIPDQAKKEPEFNRMVRSLAIEVGRNVNRHGVLEETGLGTGDKIAGRACAMSDVARALGFPELLVESKRITVKDGDKEIKGVMTEAAGLDTADFGYMLYTDPFYTKMDREQLNSKEMLSSLADLQILDYLCGNTDRHANNFFLKQDFSDPKNPKLLGVLGIDNDNSFGSLEEGGVQNLAHQSNLQIITPKMADAIEKMTRDDLSNLLKPYEFKEEQVDAAQTRLENLKDLVKQGRKDTKLQIGANGKIQNKESSIHIVQDDEWEKLDLQKLTPEIVYEKDKDGKIKKDKKGNPIVAERIVNIFTMAQSDYDIHHEAERDRNIADYRKVPYSLGPNKGKAPIQYNEQKQKEPEKQQAPELDYAALDMFHQQEAEKFKAIKQRLYDNGGDRMNKRSGEFKEMWSALDKYITSYETLHNILMEDTRVKPEDIVDEKKVLTAEQKAAKAEVQTWRKEIAKERKLEAFYREMEEAKKGLDQKIDAYHNRYRRRISTRNQNRIDAAAQLKNILAEKTTSRTVYEQYQASKKSDNTIQNTAQQITNMENQIYGKMRFTLHDNLKKYSAADPIRALGTKALEAQQRLWNYSMNGLDQGDVSVKRPEKKAEMTEEQYQKELMPFEKLQKAIQEEKNKNPNIDQVQKDLKTLALYTSQLAESGVLPKATANEFSNMIESIQKVDQDAINRIGEIDENAIKAIPSREIRGVLHTLYQNELTIAQKPEKKMERNPENGKKTLIQEKISKITTHNGKGEKLCRMKEKQTIDETFDADREREQIRKIGEGMNRLAAHWAYLGDFRGGRSSREFWTAKHRLQRLCGVSEAGDEPDFAESMQDRSLQSLEKSVDATLKAMKAYEERHSTFFGFLARLFNLVSYARMQDTEIAIRRLQEMKNSIVRLRDHGEELNVPTAENTADKENQIADEEKTAEKSAEKTVEKTVGKTAEKSVEKASEKKPEKKEKKTTEKAEKEPVEKTAGKRSEEPKEPEASKESEESKESEAPEASYEPAYDEKRELAFRNMAASDRSPLKTKQGQEEFLQGYEDFTINHPDQLDAFNSNDIQVLKKLSQDLSKDVAGLDSYLERRMKNLQKIDQLEKKSEQNFKQRQTHEPLIQKNNGETTTVILTDVTQPQLQHTLCGCWSVALSSMLRQKGVEIDQETIRAFRPDKKICSAFDLQAVNGDRCNAIDLSRELIMKVVPDTALNSVQTEVSHYNTDASWKPWNEQEKIEKRSEFKEKMRAVLKRSLETDKGSLAILMKDHYQTVYGYEKVEKDGKAEEYVYIHDPNDPNKTKMTLDELAESGYKVEKDQVNAQSKGTIISETYSFDAQWLQDLTNDKGELALDAGLESKGVTYKDHELKCNNLIPYSNQADANANWKALSNQMDQEISIKTYLPATVKNLAKNRVLDPIKPSELTHRERKLTGSDPRKHTMQKEASGLSEVKKPEDLRISPPVK